MPKRKLRDHSRSTKKKRGSKISGPQITRLWRYFEMGVSARFASRQGTVENIVMPGLTACIAYFSNWKEELFEEQFTDLAVRQREAKSQFLVAYDKIIFSNEAMVNKYMHASNQHKLDWENTKGEGTGSYRPLISLDEMVRKLLRFKSDLLVSKTAVEIAPMVDEKTESAALDQLRKQFQDIKTKETE